MKEWNAMTNDERRVVVLTRVCGWKVVESGVDIKTQWFFRPDEDPEERIGILAHQLPPILTSADAALEHVAPVIGAKGCAIEYVDAIEHGIVTIKAPFDGVSWKELAFSVSKAETYSERFAPALCEAAYRMVTGEEDTKGVVTE